MSSKIGSTIIIIGHVGSGKTPTCKNILKTSNYTNVAIYDPRNEYNFESKYEVKKYISGPEFISTVKTLKRNFVIFEEATSIFSMSKNLDITELFIAIEHNQNISVCIFHSLLDVPKFLLRLSQYIILFPTSDDPEDVKSSRKKYYPYLIKSFEKNKKLKPGEYKKAVILKQR